MSITIALAGNPNCGKSTLFNALTGSNQYVGNWPGVTVSKKTGTYKKDKEIKITDLPGIYSLSPYTLEEVVSREYLIDGKPDVIVDVIDASNIERNLYLSTQLSEIGIPMVIALNMMDVVEKNGDKIDVENFILREFPNKREILVSELSEAYFEIFGIRKFYEEFKKDLKKSMRYKAHSIKKVKYIVRLV